jgi:hypothetical protein
VKHPKMKQNQCFKWSSLDETNVISERRFLMMPNEVEEFHRLTGEGIEFTFNEAFERITGREVTHRMHELRLVVEIYNP